MMNNNNNNIETETETEIEIETETDIITTMVLRKKIHNLQRTKLRLKNQLNKIIESLRNDNEALKQSNNQLTAELEWMSEWDTYT